MCYRYSFSSYKREYGVQLSACLLVSVLLQWYEVRCYNLRRAIGVSSCLISENTEFNSLHVYWEVLSSGGVRYQVATLVGVKYPCTFDSCHLRRVIIYSKTVVFNN